MKKTLLFLFIVFGFYINFPNITFAACQTFTGGLNCPETYPVTCSSGGSGSNHHFQCCSTQAECAAITPVPGTTTQGTAHICNSISDSEQRSSCVGCMDDSHVWTALGCLDTTSGGFVTNLFQLGIGIAGGIAFLLVLFGALQIMTSAGNPEKLNAGKELVTAAITGLLFIIFSIFLLRLIGVNILGIPTFQ